MVGGYLSPFAFILFRVVIATMLFYGVRRIFPYERVERKDLAYLALCALTGVAINQLCFFVGLEKTSPIHASLIMTSSPILVILIAWIYYKEPMSFRKILGVGLGLMGAILLISQGAQETQQVASLEGDLFVLINSTSYAFYLILVNKMLAKYKPLTVVTWVFFFGVLFVLPFGFKDLISADFSAMPFNILLSIGFVVFFTTFINYLLNAFALGRVSPAIVSFYIYFQPLIASLLSVWLGVDGIDAVKIISAALLFSGVYLSSSMAK